MNRVMYLETHTTNQTRRHLTTRERVLSGLDVCLHAFLPTDLNSMDLGTDMTVLQYHI